jgi:hypothetical protein
VANSVGYWAGRLPQWLDEPYRKLAWADRHLNTLDREIKAYLGPPVPYAITDRIDRDGAEHVLWINVINPPPADLSLIVGDCVQNLRSSLEYFMHQLTLRTGGTPDRRTQFPIFATPGQFKQKGGERMLKQLIEPAARSFVMRNQPSESGLGYADPLLYLADLSDGDKHRLLQPLRVYCTHLPLGVTWRMTPDDPGFRIYEGPYDGETVFAHIPFAVADESMDVSVRPQMTVALQQAVMHKDIVERLKLMIGRVLGILLDARSL